MRKIIKLALICFICSSNAMAQDIATEHTQLLNFAQLIISAEHELSSLLNQATQIELQVEQLKSIATYPDVFVDVNLQRSQLFDLVEQGISLSSQIQNQLSTMKQIAQQIASNQTLSNQDQLIAQQADNTITITLGQINTARQNYQVQEAALQSMVSKSNGAVGQTQALQVLNQIQAQNGTQMQATQEALNNVSALLAAKMTEEDQEKQAATSRVDTMIHPIATGSSSYDYGQN